MRSWQRVLVAVTAGAALGATTVTSAGAQAAVALDDLPEGVPAAALRAEPVLASPDGWPFPGTFPRTAGVGRLDGGALLWTDWVHDDHGAAEPIANPLHARTLDKGQLAPANGSYTYPDGPASGNGADVFRAAVGRDATSTWWRVDWTTLVDAAVPLAVWTFDTDADTSTGTAAWPAAAGVSSAGWDVALVVSGTSATLVGADGTETDVTAGLAVDLDSRSFVVRVPTATLPVDGTWTVRLGAGLADVDGTGLAEPTLGAAPLDAGLLGALGRPRLYNVPFRTHEQEPPQFTSGNTVLLATALQTALDALPPTEQLGMAGVVNAVVTANMWNEDAQADALFGGDVSAFALDVDWAALAAGTTTPEPRPTGWTTRWYVTDVVLGEGVVPDATGEDLEPKFPGPLQPYAVYVPSTYDPATPAPLTWILHSLSVNHNQYAGFNPRLTEQLCEDRGAICVTTLGRGPDGWYFDEAEVDLWQVWREVAGAFTLDPERTTLTGYSMGGFGTYKLGYVHPDLFASLMVLGAPTSCGFSFADGFRGSDDDGSRCGTSGRTVPLVSGSRWTPIADGKSAVDELAPITQTIEMNQALDDLGHRYDLTIYPALEHLGLAVQDRFDSVVAAVPTDPRVVDPGVVSLTWYGHLDDPQLGIGVTTAYWLSDLAARDPSPGVTSRVDAVSAAIPDAAITPVRTGLDLATSPIPAGQRRLTWELGAVPAAAQRLDLTLANVAGLTVDTDRAGLACFDLGVTSDGDTSVTLVGLDAGDEVRRGDALVDTATADGIAAVAVGTGDDEVRVCAAVAAGPTPTPAPTTPTSPTPEPTTAPDPTPTPTLPATGGGATALGLLLALAAGAVTPRRRPRSGAPSGT